MAQLTTIPGRVHLDLSREEAAALFALYSNAKPRDVRELFGVTTDEHFGLCEQFLEAGVDAFPFGFTIARNPGAEVVRR